MIQGVVPFFTNALAICNLYFPNCNTASFQPFNCFVTSLNLHEKCPDLNPIFHTSQACSIFQGIASVTNVATIDSIFVLL